MTDDQEWAILTARIPRPLLVRLLDEAEAHGFTFSEVVTALLTSGLPEEPSETVTEWGVRDGSDGTVLFFGEDEAAARELTRLGTVVTRTATLSRSPWRPEVDG